MIAQPAVIAVPTSLAPARGDEELPRGAAILIEALAHEGVDSIFGYPGGAVLHIYDELWRARERITHYLVRHEQGAVHMAEGYARASGRVGVARHGGRVCARGSKNSLCASTVPQSRSSRRL